MILIIEAVHLLQRIGHEARHLVHRQIRLNIVPCRIENVQERIDIPRTKNRTDNGLNHFLLMGLTRKVTRRKQMTLTRKGKRLLTIEQNVITRRHPYGIGTALTRRVLTDEFHRRIDNDAAQRIHHIHDALEIRINVVVDIHTDQILNRLNRAVNRNRMSRIQLTVTAVIAADRNIGVTRQRRHRHLHRNRVDRAENHRIAQTVRIADQQNRKRLLRNILVRTRYIGHRNRIRIIRNRTCRRKEIGNAALIGKHGRIVGRQNRRINLPADQTQKKTAVILILLIGNRRTAGIDIRLANVRNTRTCRKADRPAVKLIDRRNRFSRSISTVHNNRSINRRRRCRRRDLRHILVDADNRIRTVAADHAQRRHKNQGNNVEALPVFQDSASNQEIHHPDQHQNNDIDQNELSLREGRELRHIEHHKDHKRRRRS